MCIYISVYNALAYESTPTTPTSTPTTPTTSTCAPPSTVQEDIWLVLFSSLHDRDLHKLKLATLF